MSLILIHNIKHSIRIKQDVKCNVIYYATMTFEMAVFINVQDINVLWVGHIQFLEGYL